VIGISFYLQIITILKDLEEKRKFPKKKFDANGNKYIEIKVATISVYTGLFSFVEQWTRKKSTKMRTKRKAKNYLTSRSHRFQRATTKVNHPV
jgi:hypothetical protein